MTYIQIDPSLVFYSRVSVQIPEIDHEGTLLLVDIRVSMYVQRSRTPNKGEVQLSLLFANGIRFLSEPNPVINL